MVPETMQSYFNKTSTNLAVTNEKHQIERGGRVVGGQEFDSSGRQNSSELHSWARCEECRELTGGRTNMGPALTGASVCYISLKIT